jgi:hypothetical protein
VGGGTEETTSADVRGASFRTACGGGAFFNTAFGGGGEQGDGGEGDGDSSSSNRACNPQDFFLRGAEFSFPPS